MKSHIIFMVALVSFLTLVMAYETSAVDSYVVEVAHNDEMFIINGEKFEAMSYCFNMQEGDSVVFLNGSPLGACATAELLNLRTKDVCSVFCE